MPELPEIEVYRRQLAQWVGGQTLHEIRMVDQAIVRKSLSSKPTDALPDGERHLQDLVGRSSGELRRHGKRMGWSFGDKSLLAHFGMTGGFTRRGLDDPPPPSSRVGLVFDDVVIWYTDDRRMGCVTPVPTDELPQRLRKDCGPDALEEPLDGPGLKRAVSCKKPIKVALMEQDRIAGLGNIHAAEACFRAGVWPKKLATQLTDREWDRLARGVVEQLSWSVEEELKNGEHFYVNKGGPNFFAVYRKDGEPCQVCGTTIVCEEQSGRTTYWCPRCQPESLCP
jgi:formamidopyrimidine-DNA glycosylase